MDKTDQIYGRLQQHLDKYAAGFRPTLSGIEIEILRYVFTPQDAEIATHLSYRPESLETVFERVQHLVASCEELANALERIHGNGGIKSEVKDGKRMYCSLPLVVLSLRAFQDEF